MIRVKGQQAKPNAQLLSMQMKVVKVIKILLITDPK